jgi:hypothetical protein
MVQAGEMACDRGENKGAAERKEGGKSAEMGANCGSASSAMDPVSVPLPPLCHYHVELHFTRNANGAGKQHNKHSF